MPEPMKPEIAFNNIVRVVCAYKGSFEEHAILQEALRVIRELMTPKAAPKEAALKAALIAAGATDDDLAAVAS